MMFSENRYPLFGIMLQSGAAAAHVAVAAGRRFNPASARAVLDRAGPDAAAAGTRLI
jgi:hypothetical protein